jgi:hypothetical protein
MQSIESHDRQIGELTVQVGELGRSIDKLVTVTDEDATAIRALARIAEAWLLGSPSLINQNRFAMKACRWVSEGRMRSRSRSGSKGLFWRLPSATLSMSV